MLILPWILWLFYLFFAWFLSNFNIDLQHLKLQLLSYNNFSLLYHINHSIFVLFHRPSELLHLYITQLFWWDWACQWIVFGQVSWHQLWQIHFQESSFSILFAIRWCFFWYRWSHRKVPIFMYLMFLKLFRDLGQIFWILSAILSNEWHCLPFPYFYDLEHFAPLSSLLIFRVGHLVI